MFQFANQVHDRGSLSLFVCSDRGLSLGQQFVGISRRDLFKMLGVRSRLPVEEVAAPIDSVIRDLECTQNRAGELIASVAELDHVSPRIRRVGRMHADRIAMHAPQRLARLNFPLATTDVTQDELIGCEANCFADRIGRDPFGQAPHPQSRRLDRESP